VSISASGPFRLAQTNDGRYVQSEFILYGVPASPYVRSATSGLEKKGANFRIYALRPFESRSPAYLKLHPFGRVPVLRHGGFELYETQAILRYLDRIISEPSLTPRDPRAEARMNQLCGITDWYVMPHITMGIAFERLIAPMLAPHLSFFAEAPESTALMAAHPQLLAWIDRMDSRVSVRNTTSEKLAAKAQA
jgi:glutathione S-transferase